MSILAGDGFAYDVPSRAKGNQVYVKVGRAGSCRGGWAGHVLGQVAGQVVGTALCQVAGSEPRQMAGLAPGPLLDGRRRRSCALWPQGRLTLNPLKPPPHCTHTRTQELDRIVLRESTSKRPFASTASCRKVGGCSGAGRGLILDYGRPEGESEHKETKQNKCSPKAEQ